MLDPIEAGVEPVLLPAESLVDSFKAPVNRIETSVQPLVLSVEAFFQVLNEFLVHTTPAVSKD